MELLQEVDDIWRLGEMAHETVVPSIDTIYCIICIDKPIFLCYDMSKSPICEKSGYLQRMTSYGLPASLGR